MNAQSDYFDRTRQASGVETYATRLLSTPERRDGLYWPVAAGETESRTPDRFSAGCGISGRVGRGTLFSYPPGTGPNGDGGAKNYIRSGRMTSGFALIAWPATFESSGIMTFIVGPDGDVYQKDLGPDTTHVASGITRFDPDLTWARVAVTND